MMEDFEIFGSRIAPGSTFVTSLPIASRYDYSDASIPIKVIHGKKEGPVLFISAAVHGDELNGIEIIKRLSKHKLIRKLQGTLILVPIVNIFGFQHQARYLPDRRDLNRVFPGSREGSIGARLAHSFIENIVSRSNFGVDLHTGAIHRFNLPQIRANLDDPGILELGESFNMPVLVNAGVRDGSLRECGEKMNIPIFLFEGGEALRFDEPVIQLALKGILSFMRKIKMLPPLPLEDNKKTPMFVAKSSSWVRAPHSGTVRLLKTVGAFVEKDEVIGLISDPFGDRAVKVYAKKEGVIIGVSRLPLVLPGDALFHVATVDSDQGLEDLYEEDKYLIPSWL